MPFTLCDKARHFHTQLPPGPKHALQRFGILKVHIFTRLLGWDGARITVPLICHDGTVIGFEYWRPTGEGFEVDQTDCELLYGVDDLDEKPATVVITEGIEEALVLRGLNFNAVSATGDGRTFKPLWEKRLCDAGEVFVCFKCSPESLAAARTIAERFPHAHLLNLPQSVGLNGGLYEFFYRLKATRMDFLRLLSEASSPKSDG